MQFFSIDIETTGLDSKKHGITEFAAIFADLEGKQEPKTFHRWLNPEDYVWSVYCLNLHSAWLQRVVQRILVREWEPSVPGEPIICKHHEDFVTQFFGWLIHDCKIPLKEGRPEKITPAGKNFSSFDFRFLEPLFPMLFRHRALDPTQHYLRTDDKIPPDLALCKDRAKADGCQFTHEGVSHTALDDAWDVVKLLQWKAP